MTVAALILWLCTACVGTYLLINGIGAGRAAAEAEADAAEAEARAAETAGPGTTAAGTAAQSAGTTTAGTATAAAPPRISGRKNDPWDPPTLKRAKSEPMPGLRDLAEFTHPALALIGFGFMAGYLISGDRLFAFITLGMVLGVICAGLTWFGVNRRDALRRKASGAGSAGAMRFSPRVLLLHGAGALLTLVFVALLAARV